MAVTAHRRSQPKRSVCPATLVLLSLWAALTAPLAAQELTLRREYPGLTSYECPAQPRAAEPSLPEQAQATQVASAAGQAVILGDLDRARALLERATELDPTSAELAYRLARVLDDAGDRTQAVAEYCRTLSLGTSSEEAGFARDRIDALVDLEVASIPEAARIAFDMGVSAFDEGFLEDARESFSVAASQAPAWQLPYYNEGVTLAALGRDDEAVASLRRYLELDPEAADVVAVSQRIGQLEGRLVFSGPNPSTALTLGFVFPGLGQYYSGRSLRGTAVTSLAVGALAMGFLVQKRDVRCLVAVNPGEGCPTGEVARIDMSRPYLTAGLGVALGASLIGALDAYLGARGQRRTLASTEARGPRVEGPSISSRRGIVEIRFVNLRLR